jgi:hypothetical protein
MSCRVRFRVRSRVQPRVRLRVRLRVLRLFARQPVLCCSSAVFAGGCVCEKSMSVGNCAFGCLASGGLRLCAPAAGGGAVACSPCRRLLCAVAACCAAVLLVASLVMVTAGGCVGVADRVVASRRLLWSLARLRRPRLCSAGRCGSATVSWGYTVSPPLSRRMAGRWGHGRRSAALGGSQ